MATERLKTIKSSGGDYTSLAAAEAGEDDLGDLVSRDEWMHFSCYAMEDTSLTTIDGWTTDSTRYILVDTPSSEMHDGKWNTAKYRINRSGSSDQWEAAITINEENTRIGGLQIYARGIAISLGSAIAYNAQIYDCVLRGMGYNESYKCGVRVDNASGTANIRVWNCIAYDFGGTTGSHGGGFFVNKDLETLNVYFYNCTSHSCVRGFSRSVDENTIFKNCLAAGCVDGFYSAWKFTGSDYNASDLASDAPGENSRNSQTFTFVDAANDDFHLTSNDAGARNYGVSDPGSGLYSDDIDGQTRSGTWDIGADEYVASGASIPLSNPFSRPFSQSLGRGGL